MPSSAARSTTRSRPMWRPLPLRSSSYSRLRRSPTETTQQPKRQPLHAHLPRLEVRNEPASTGCGCDCATRRIGEDIAEKRDYAPGVFTVGCHVHGKWACAKRETITQAPVEAQVTDKDIPTSGLQAAGRPSAVVAPGRHPCACLPCHPAFHPGDTCGVRLPLLADAAKAEMLGRRVLHADETPVQMLKPDKGATHRAQGLRPRRLRRATAPFLCGTQKRSVSFAGIGIRYQLPQCGPRCAAKRSWHLQRRLCTEAAPHGLRHSAQEFLYEQNHRQGTTQPQHLNCPAFPPGRTDQYAFTRMRFSWP